MSMQKEVMQMDGKNLSKESSPTFHPALKFMYWQKFCWDTENLPVGFINSTMMEKRSKISMMGQYLFENLGLAKISPFTSDLVKAYEAPFQIHLSKWVLAQCPVMFQLFQINL